MGKEKQGGEVPPQSKSKDILWTSKSEHMTFGHFLIGLRGNVNIDQMDSTVHLGTSLVSSHTRYKRKILQRLHSLFYLNSFTSAFASCKSLMRNRCGIVHTGGRTLLFAF